MQEQEDQVIPILIYPGFLEDDMEKEDIEVELDEMEEMEEMDHLDNKETLDNMDKMEEMVEMVGMG